ncbi:MAG: hypothetical protein JNK05_36495 [Myxococcales bacterium]|nr:hypothetical protein [Myxococcales bacterium]
MIAHEHQPGSSFWAEVFSLSGSATIRVLPRAMIFVFIALLATILRRYMPWVSISADVMEAPGLVLGLLLVFRTAAGYDRWWEARKLWGGIINQSRNIVVSSLAFGPANHGWRGKLVFWVIAHAQATRHVLRGERSMPELDRLLKSRSLEPIPTDAHLPTYASSKIAALLHTACLDHQTDRFVFAQIDRERATLMEHVGGCERIAATPIPRVYSVTIRRFVFLYLAALSLSLVGEAGFSSMIYTFFIAYPILTLEQIGAELQNPFVVRSLSHIEIDEVCAALERELTLSLERWTDAPVQAAGSCP